MPLPQPTPHAFLTIVFSSARAREARGLAEALRHAVREAHARGECAYGQSGALPLAAFRPSPSGALLAQAAADADARTAVHNPFSAGAVAAAAAAAAAGRAPPVLCFLLTPREFNALVGGWLARVGEGGNGGAPPPPPPPPGAAFALFALAEGGEGGEGGGGGGGGGYGSSSSSAEAAEEARDWLLALGARQLCEVGKSGWGSFLAACVRALGREGGGAAGPLPAAASPRTARNPLSSTAPAAQQQQQRRGAAAAAPSQQQEAAASALLASGALVRTAERDLPFLPGVAAGAGGDGGSVAASSVSPLAQYFLSEHEGAGRVARGGVAPAMHNLLQRQRQHALHPGAFFPQ